MKFFVFLISKTSLFPEKTTGCEREAFFWRFTKQAMCPKMPSMQKSSTDVRPVVGGASWCTYKGLQTRALTKKRGKKREIEGSDGKLLVCGKKGEKKEGRREKGEKGNFEENFEKGKNCPECRRPATRANVVQVPSTFAKRPCSAKNAGKIAKNAHHDLHPSSARQALGSGFLTPSTKWDRQEESTTAKNPPKMPQN